MIQFQENTHTHTHTHTHTQMSGGKDKQTLFHRILPATAMGLRSKTAVKWHLKVKDIEYNVGLTKSYYITVSTQKISSIHKLVQQILGSHELNGHAQYDNIHPKIIEATFSFPEFAPACKKSVHSINLFLRYSPYWPNPSLTMPTQKPFV